jgi:alpha-mannosidase
MNPKPTFWFIAHTHWEGAVFETREDYLDVGLPHILMALNLLKTQPTYRFVLDQAAYVKPFLERYPEEVGAFRQFVAEGRLQCVGGSDVINDCNLPCGETLVRHILYGKRFFRDALGVDITTWWALDTFGHNAQMPQILKSAGFKSMWFSRGAPHGDLPSEFRWQGLDGSQIDAYWLPFNYAHLYDSPKELDGFTKFCVERFTQLDPHTRGPHRVGLAGLDVCPPEPHVAPLIEEFNRQPDAPFMLRLAVPADYEAAVTERGGEPVIVTGELNPIFQGTYSSRIEIKQWIRSLERLLLTAEQWSAVAQWLGTPADNEALWRAWEPVLFNEAHDLAAGVMTDPVYDDTIRSFDFAKRIADESLDHSWEQIATHIDTQGEGIPLVVWNTLGWSRTDVAEVEVALAGDGVRVVDSEGRTIPVQIVQSQPGVMARIAFLARDVPALGYAVYRVIPASAEPPSGEIPAEPTEVGAANAVLENEHYRLTFDPGTGAITSMIDKPENREVLAGPANVVTCQVDKGDLWELYEGLNAGSQVAMTRKQPVPQPGQARLSNQEPGTATVRNGPVFSEFHVAHPFGNGNFATTVRLYHGLRRVDVRTELLNNDKLVRYQALFPTTIKNGHNVHEIPFGAIERPNAIEFPAQTWVDHSDGRHGFVVLNEGLPGNVATDGTLMLSLLRAHTLGAYEHVAGYEPRMGSDSGLQLGKQFTLHYAFLTHAGDWRESRVWREGQEFNHPLICRKAQTHTGSLPSRWGLLTISHANVVLSSLKPGPDGATILRVYETTGVATPGVQIKFNAAVAGADEADLLEQSTQRLEVEHNALRFDLAPFEIKTFKLNLDTIPTNETI